MVEIKFEARFVFGAGDDRLANVRRRPRTSLDRRGLTSSVRSSSAAS